ncbi:MAG TPA: polyprenol phosphomannose-dependent alpha 1,6 mannosyltransferase MptB [Thermomicrobiales bacterium]|nr:polyprenol phosphomannose-dependent alpha 1,6 mannosyltransferase MptB [Thermomicrobiales bacterium]
MLAGALLLLVAFPFDGNQDALVDLRLMSDASEQGLLVWTVALVLLTGGWVGGILAARGRALRKVRLPVTAFTVLASVAMLLTYPGTAIDVYIYAARSHLLTDLGLDPSTTLPETLWDIDPYVRYASNEWANDPSPYGPLWNLIAAPATAFDDENIAVAVVIFKAIMAAGVAITGWLIHDIARRVQPGLAASATIGWLWSPVVLWEGIANGHNDVLLALLLVTALWCWYRGYLGSLLPLLGAASLLKVVAMITIPAAAVAIIRRTGWNRALAAIAGRAALFSLLIAWVAFAPFYDVAGVIDAIRAQTTVIVTSPALLAQAISNELGWGLDVGEDFPTFGVPMIILLTLAGAIAAWLRPSQFPTIAYEQLFWFLVLATSNLRPWYTIWLVALGLALPLGMPFARAAAFAIGGLGTYAYLLWVRHWYAAEWLVEVGITVGIMLGPTLLVTLWAAFSPLHRRLRQAHAVPTEA